MIVFYNYSPSRLFKVLFTLRVLQWNAGGLRARSTELLHFRSIPLTLSVSRNLTHPLVWHSLMMPRALAVASSFLSGRAYSCLNFLPSLFLCLISTLDYVGVNISLNNSPLLSFLNVLAPPIHSSLIDGRTDSFSPSILPSSSNLFILGDFNCHHPPLGLRGTSKPSGEEVFDWVISSDLPLNNLDIPTLLHHSSDSRFSPDISFAPSSLAFSCF